MKEPILKKTEFFKLDQQQQFELLETWRRENTDKVIYQAMGMGSHSYYRLVKELGCTPKDTSPNRNKNQVSPPTPQVDGEETESVAVQSITLSLEHLATKEQADILFQSIVGFLGDGAYKIKVEVTK